MCWVLPPVLNVLLFAVRPGEVARIGRCGQVLPMWTCPTPAGKWKRVKAFSTSPLSAILAGGSSFPDASQVQPCHYLYPVGFIKYLSTSNVLRETASRRGRLTLVIGISVVSGGIPRTSTDSAKNYARECLLLVGSSIAPGSFCPACIHGGHDPRSQATRPPEFGTPPRLQYGVYSAYLVEASITEPDDGCPIDRSHFNLPYRAFIKR
ncbi:hypothetical protein K438DRAFT_1779368 [Mycena galopus ATCC 62051]|nr:hypothetical protein K438DRAFT_1779368 [Mycena galopus ATCC 62051]